MINPTVALVDTLTADVVIAIVNEMVAIVVDDMVIYSNVVFHKTVLDAIVGETSCVVR